jgi:hypothetical protein
MVTTEPDAGLGFWEGRRYADAAVSALGSVDHGPCAAPVYHSFHPVAAPASQAVTVPLLLRRGIEGLSPISQQRSQLDTLASGHRGAVRDEPTLHPMTRNKGDQT